ncbi:MAG: class I SAM-dependent methyltransferase [Myxococcota bacterium]
MPSGSDARCLVCGGESPQVRYRIPRYSVLECRDCRQVFLWPLPSPEEIRGLFREFYTTGQAGSLPELDGYYLYCFDDSPANPLVRCYERWLAALERHQPPGRLLDVGCGTGLFLSVAQRRGWQVVGVDESPEGVKHARESFGVDAREGQFDAFEAEGSRFDAITGWDIIEHSRTPVELLRAMRRHLAPGGVVGLSTPNQESLVERVASALYHATGGWLTAPLEKLYFDQHFLYFTPATLRSALTRAGLGVLELEQEATDLERLNLSAAMRVGLQALFRVSRWVGLENRLFVLARPRLPGAPDPAGSAEGGGAG